MRFCKIVRSAVRTGLDLFLFFLKMDKKHLDLSDYHAISSSPEFDPVVHDAQLNQLKTYFFIPLEGFGLDFHQY